ncbi:MAG: acetyl-CoA carboxylase biotin carboxyl carrier protein subunit [Dehalococcoidia bacterium]|nr:acetyl-CoA carboxylase biotin carboxyl carrier protein subunit [Dehalococcoidia bacterium]
MSQEIIEAPIPGKIISVNVCAGDSVEEDAEVCVLQSMKMQNPILSPVDGKVLEVKIVAGQTVETGDVLLVIEES